MVQFPTGSSCVSPPGIEQDTVRMIALAAAPSTQETNMAVFKRMLGWPSDTVFV